MSLQEILTEYQAGIEITELKLQDVQPPPPVIDAFNDVQRALQDRDRLRNEADGEAQRFVSVYEAYRQNPEVARRRMYLETMQGVLAASDKVILDSSIGGGAVPYLPLNELRGRTGSSTRQ